MPFTFSKNSNFNFGNSSGAENFSKSVENQLASSPTVSTAKTGVLTTRTDDNTGTLTMDAGHGISTGDKLDLYWSGGRRQNMTVGTVAGNSVPIDLGAGDNLPVADTAITAMVPVAQPFVATGDDLTVITANLSGGDNSSPGQITIFAAGTLSYTIELVPSGGGGYTWYLESGVDNPLAGVAVDEVKFSYGGSTVAARMVLTVGFE